MPTNRLRTHTTYIDQLRQLLALGEKVGKTEREIFISDDYDDNSVRSVKGKCYVQHDQEICTLA